MDTFCLTDEDHITALGFSTKKRDLLARLIRWFTGSKCSHAWIVFHDVTLGMLVVMEATGSGFRLVPYNYFARNNDIVDVVPVHSTKLGVGIRMAAKKLGAPYDVWGLVGAAMVMVGRWFKRQWKNPLEVRGALYCSEIVALVLIWSGYPGAGELVPSQMTPEDLRVFIRRKESS